MVLVATVGLALKGIWARLAFADGLTVEGVLFYRSALAAPLVAGLGAWWGLRRKGSATIEAQRHSARDWAYAVALGAAFSVGMWCDFQAISLLGAGISRVLLFGFPLVVLLLESLQTRRWPQGHQLFGFAIAWGGLMAVALARSSSPLHSALDPSGLWWASASLVLYAAYVWLSGKVARRLGSVRMSVAAQLATATVVVGVLLWRGDGVPPVAPDNSLLWIVGMVLLSTVVPYFLMTEGIVRLGSAGASLLAMFGSTVTLGAGAVVLGERMTGAQWLGTVATLIGVTLSQRSPSDLARVFRLPSKSV